MAKTEYVNQNPRYIRQNGVWYVRKDHVADQLKRAVKSAVMDGMIAAAAPLPILRQPRGQYRSKAKREKILALPKLEAAE